MNKIYEMRHIYEQYQQVKKTQNPMENIAFSNACYIRIWRIYGIC